MNQRKSDQGRSRRWAFAGLLFLFFYAPLHAGPQALGLIYLREVYPRIVTPNGDGANDLIFFEFDDNTVAGDSNSVDLTGIPIETDVYDIHGAHVASLTTFDGDSMTWDGKTGGVEAPAGIYIYSIKLGKNMVTGTVVVAN